MSQIQELLLIAAVAAPVAVVVAMNFTLFFAGERDTLLLPLPGGLASGTTAVHPVAKSRPAPAAVEAANDAMAEQAA